MKIIFTALILLSTLSTAVAQSFSPQNSGVTTQLNGIHFSSPATGIVVGNGGVIRKTSNAGLTWSASNSGTTADLYDVVHITSSTFFAVGKVGTILKTTNAGISWTTVSSGTSNDLLGICATGLDLYITGSNGTVLKSTNSGNAWTALSTGISLKLNKPYFLSSSIGYVVGDAGTILNTTNGGQSWNFLTSGTNTHALTGVCFPELTKGVITGGVSASGTGLLLNTTNAGAFWSDEEVSGAFLSAVDFPDNSVGFAVGGNITGNTSVILKTTNQGNSWTPVASSSFRLLGVCFPNVNIGYACGLNGTILRYTTSTLGLEENASSLIQITPNPGKGIFTVSSNAGTEFTVELFSPEGKQIAHNPHSETIDLSDFPAGIYVVTVHSGTSNTIHRLVKE